MEAEAEAVDFLKLKVEAEAEAAPNSPLPDTLPWSKMAQFFTSITEIVKKKKNEEEEVTGKKEAKEESYFTCARRHIDGTLESSRGLFSRSCCNSWRRPKEGL